MRKQAFRDWLAMSIKFQRERLAFNKHLFKEKGDEVAETRCLYNVHTLDTLRGIARRLRL